VFNKADCSKTGTVSLKVSESPGHSLSSYGLNGIPIPPTPKTTKTFLLSETATSV